MSVLIVGGAGYIGSQTAKLVAAAGLEPIVFDNLVYGHEWAVKWGPLVRGDLADRALLVDVMKRHGVDAVIHFAAYAYVGESVTNPRKYFGNNVAGTLSLLDAMLDAGVRDVVFSSTCATYGEPQRVPIAEDHPQNPVNPYGETKLAVEKMLHWYSAGVRPALRGAALLQRRRRRSGRRDRRGPRPGDAPHPARDRRGAAAERGTLEIFGTDYPTPDGTCDPRLHPRRRSGRRAPARAREAARRQRRRCASTSAPAAGIRCARWWRRCEKVTGRARAASERSGAAPAIPPRWWPTRARRRRCSAGSRATPSSRSSSSTRARWRERRVRAAR